MVTAPIGTGHLHQLEVLQLARTRHVRAAAEVFELAFAVQRDVFVRRDARDDLGLVVLAQALEIGHRLVAWQHTALNLLVLLRQLRHLGFDGDQVFGREGSLVREVVVEAVFDDRADRDLRLGEELLHRIRQQVRGRVADDFQAVGVFLGQDRQHRVGVDAVAGVDDLGLGALPHAAGQSGLGQAGADGGRDLGHRHGAFELTLGTVGQLNGNHDEQTPESKKRGDEPRFLMMTRRDVTKPRPTKPFPAGS